MSERDAALPDYGMPDKWVQDVPDGDERQKDSYRASGQCLCDICGREYWRHKYASRPLSYDGRPYLNVLCNGDLVKL